VCGDDRALSGLRIRLLLNMHMGPVIDEEKRGESSSPSSDLVLVKSVPFE
jgi:hypothetical protein